MDDFSKAYAEGMGAQEPSRKKRKGYDANDLNDAPVLPPPKDRDALKNRSMAQKGYSGPRLVDGQCHVHRLTMVYLRADRGWKNTPWNAVWCRRRGR